MSRIIWEGNQEWGRTFRDRPLPEGARRVNRPDDIVSASMPYMMLPGAMCFLAVFVKSRMAGQFLFDLWFVPLAFVVGFFTAMPLHELLHALCYPPEAEVYIGVCVRRLRAYAVSACPLTRGRFIAMSLAPALSGLAALAVFLACPVMWGPLMTVSMVSAFMGLLSPAPDYLDVLLVLRQVPMGAMIQATNEGIFWYPRRDKKRCKKEADEPCS